MSLAQLDKLLGRIPYFKGPACPTLHNNILEQRKHLSDDRFTMPRVLQDSLIYRINLTIPENRFEKAFSILSAQERKRADRYQVEAPRRQFIACRAALRVLLSQYIGCPPAEIQLTSGRFGKPYLKAAKEGQSFHFNVSHSADLGLIGLSQSPIGVDLEQITPRIQARSLVSMVLSPQETALWRQLSPSLHQEQIVNLWVCKEAFLKAVGLGIADCLQQVSFPIPLPTDQPFAPSDIDASLQIHLEEEGNCYSNPWMIANLWRIHPLRVSTNHVAAVALFDTTKSVVCKEFDWTFLG